MVAIACPYRADWVRITLALQTLHRADPTQVMPLLGRARHTLAHWLLQPGVAPEDYHRLRQGLAELQHLEARAAVQLRSARAWQGFRQQLLDLCQRVHSE